MTIGEMMFNNGEENTILSKNNWDELTPEEQKEVAKDYKLNYVGTSNGTFDPVLLTINESKFSLAYIHIVGDMCQQIVKSGDEAREVILENYKQRHRRQ